MDERAKGLGSWGSGERREERAEEENRTSFSFCLTFLRMVRSPIFSQATDDKILIDENDLSLHH